MRKPLADKIQSERRVLQALRGKPCADRPAGPPLTSGGWRWALWTTSSACSPETTVHKKPRTAHALAGRLESLSPLSVLSRGYAAGVLGRRPASSDSVSRVPDEPFEVRFADGGVRVARTGNELERPDRFEGGTFEGIVKKDCTLEGYTFCDCTFSGLVPSENVRLVRCRAFFRLPLYRLPRLAAANPAFHRCTSAMAVCTDCALVGVDSACLPAGMFAEPLEAIEGQPG